MSGTSEGPGWVPTSALPPTRRTGTGERLKALRDRVTMRMVALALLGLGLVMFLVPVAAIGFGMWEENQLTESWSAGGATAATPLPSPPFIEEGGPSQPATAVATPRPTPRSTAKPVQAAFAIRVPKIGYYAAVREGVSLSVLATGPGHYPSSAMPGANGLVAIAAHNTFWIPFGRLGAGDTVVLETRSGTFTYRITGTRVVEPDDTSVLASTSDRRLVLTTCWPLWAGNLAQQRLAIFATQV